MTTGVDAQGSENCSGPLGLGDTHFGKYM